MDNRILDIRSEGFGDFKLSMHLAFTHKEVIGYRVFENKLILYWAECSNSIPLPYAMNLQDTITFCWGWVQKAIPTNKEPIHDGDNGKGFRVFNEAWGHICGEWQAFIAIEPIWALYGK